MTGVRTDLRERVTAMNDQELFHELAFYTLAQPRSTFIHQHAVDAFAVQSADASTKPIAVVFGLIGLYLAVEKGFTGLQVQEMHMRLAKKRRTWLSLPLPADRGGITIADVLSVAPGPARDAAIHRWCEAAWKPWHAARPYIVDLARVELGIE